MAYNYHMMEYAPVTLFAYKRYEHLRKTAQSLVANSEASQTDLIVYCDGPKTPQESQAVADVQKLARSITGFRSVKCHCRNENWGLARSIISGVSDMLERHEKVIVVEDDLVVSRYFIRFMNDALVKYEFEPQVGSVCAYFCPVKETLPETFFLRGADCWGWATWKRGWAFFNPKGEALLQRIEKRGLQRDFDVQGSYPYTQMLRDQIAGKNNSWAIRWQASLFLAEKLTLYPGRSLVRNIGFDSTGEHCETTSDFEVEISKDPVRVQTIPVRNHQRVERVLARYFRNITSPAHTWKTRLRRFVRKAMHK